MNDDHSETVGCVVGLLVLGAGSMLFFSSASACDGCYFTLALPIAALSCAMLTAVWWKRRWAAAEAAEAHRRHQAGLLRSLHDCVSEAQQQFSSLPQFIEWAEEWLDRAEFE